MTYNASESGLQTGKPVELYEFMRGPDAYRYTSGDAPITLNSKLYESRSMDRSKFESTREIARNALKITADASLPILDIFKPHPPGDVVTLTIYRIHRGDTEAIVAWAGRVLSVGWPDPSRAVFHCESVYSSIKRPGLRRLYQRSCPHALYSPACGISGASHVQVAQVTGVAGAVIQLSNLNATDGYFAGGYVEWEFATGKFERRAISSQIGASVTLSFAIDKIVAGATVRIFPGCDHSLATCRDKFNNLLNYGGMPFIPQKNPFGGQPVY